MRIVPVLLLAVLLVLRPEAQAAGGLVAEEGWIREAPPTAPVRAGYLTLRNAGDSVVEVVSARSPAFGAIEIHEMRTGDDGTMRMRRVERLEIPAGGIVELKPGGLHLMLFRPTGQLVKGSHAPLTLVLEGGMVVEATLEQR
jgi:hypothetical protein